MLNTAEVTSGKPIAVSSQSISSVNAFNPLVAFYDIYGRKREVLFFYFVPDTTRDITTKHQNRLNLYLFGRQMHSRMYTEITEHSYLQLPATTSGVKRVRFIELN
jgi:hypothetical protein